MDGGNNQIEQAGRSKKNSSQTIILPIAFSLTKYDWSKLEGESGKTINRLMLAINHRFQRLFSKMLELKRTRVADMSRFDVVNNIDGYVSGVYKYEGMEDVRREGEGIDIKLGLNEFGISPNNYKSLREILELIYQVGVKFPERKSDGIEYTTFKSLCYCSFPKTKHRDYVMVHIDDDVLDAIANFQLGYKFTADKLLVVGNRKLSSLSYRIYLLLIAHDFKGYYEGKLEDFREIVGVKGYNKLWSFRQKVLDRSKEKLDDLCEKGALDLSFSYEFKNHNEVIRLDIVRGKYYDNFHKETKNLEQIEPGKAENASISVQLSDKAMQLSEFLQKDFSIDLETAERIASRTTADNVDAALSKELKLKEFFDSGDSKKVKDRKAYILTSFNNFFENKKSQEQMPIPVEDEKIPDSPKEKWNKCMMGIRDNKKVPKEERDNLFLLDYDYYNPSTQYLTIAVPSEQLKENIKGWIEKSLFGKLLRKYYGKEVKLKYRVAVSN